MADSTMPNFPVPPEMRAFAEQSFDQARKAFDSFFSATQRAISSTSLPGKPCMTGVDALSFGKLLMVVPGNLRYGR